MSHLVLWLQLNNSLIHLWCQGVIPRMIGTIFNDVMNSDANIEFNITVIATPALLPATLELATAGGILRDLHGEDSRPAQP